MELNEIIFPDILTDYTIIIRISLNGKKEKLLLDMLIRSIESA